MGAAGFKGEIFADVSAVKNRLLLEVAVVGFFGGPLGLEAGFWGDELGEGRIVAECGFVGERTVVGIGFGPDGSSTAVGSGRKTVTVMNVSTSREFMILSKAA